MKKNKKLKQIASCLLVSLIALIIGYTILIPNQKTDGKNSPLAVMISNGSGGYNKLIVKKFDEIPSVYTYYGYECNNPAVTLSYNYTTNKLSYSGPAGSACQLYFKAPTLGGTLTISALRKSTNGGSSFSSISSIPTERNYKVSATCTNATGEWNYETWSLDISNISSSSPSCSIDFTQVDGTNLTPSTAFSSTGGDYLRTIVQTNATNKTSDTMTVSNMILPNATWTALTESDMTVDDSGGTWAHTAGSTTWTQNSSAGTTDYIKFTTTSEGIYKICYTIPADDTNYLLLFAANKTGTSVSISTGIKVSGPSSGTTSLCYNYGYLASAKYMYVGAYKGTANSSVSVMKTTNYNSTTGNAGNGGYRYQGANPNNYVSFNNELWRIIGTDSNGITRIIRIDSIGGYAYNILNPNSTNGENWWSKSDASGNITLSNIAAILNDYYYNGTDGSSSGICQFFRSSATATVARTCDFRGGRGLQAGYRNMIVDSTIYLGGNSYTNSTPKTQGEYDHYSTPGMSGGDLIWTGKVGLMYPSDYLYAQSTAGTLATGWLRAYGHEWLISPSSSGTYGEFSVAVGLGTNQANNPLAVRPVVSLSSSVYVVDGTGSITDPYIISGS